jgi:hypothetical protein
MSVSVSAPHVHDLVHVRLKSNVLKSGSLRVRGEDGEGVRGKRAA